MRTQPLKTNLKRFAKKTGLSLLHGVLLLLLTALALNIDYNFGPEETLVKSTVFLDELLHKRKDYTSDFVFIDVSASKQLIDRPDRGGNQAITDRAMLTRFFKAIAKKQQYQKTVLCDLMFDQPTISDDSLKYFLFRTEGIIIPYSKENNRSILPVFNDITQGYSGYKRSKGVYSSDNLVKYQYVNGSGEKTIPLKMAEHTMGMESDYKLGLLWLGENIFFNSIIYEKYIGMSDIQNTESGSKMIPLDEIVILLESNNDDFIEKFTRDKYIIIGDFENDLHQTYNENEPGSLIIANLLISLKLGTNQITFGWIIFMLICFSLLSAIILFPTKSIISALERMKETTIGVMVLEFFTFFLITGLISFLSFIFFRKHIDIFFVSIYLTGISLIKEYFNERNNKKNAKANSAH